VLNALPDIVAEFPDVVYIVLGATHPNELRTRGDTYRLGLEALVKKNKLENNVMFHNRFVELKELTEFIGAADLYITPYLDENQITSGTLAYAFGAGKAVISTPYWHAAELLSEQRGVLVPFADPAAIAREASGLLRDGARRHAMSDNAYQLGRAMVWSNTAGIYMRSFELARRQGAAAPRESVAAGVAGRRPLESPELNLDHLYHMTDSRASSSTPALLPRIPRKATAPTTMPAHSFWPCCWGSWRKLPSGSGRWPQLRRVSGLCLRSKDHAFPQFPGYRPPLARPTGVRRLSWPGDLGAGHGGGPLAALEFPDYGRATLRAGAAGRHGVHFAARLGIQPHWHSRIPAPDERRPRGHDVRENLTGG